MHRGFSIHFLFPRRLPAQIAIFTLAAISLSCIAGCKHGPDASTPKKAAAIFAQAAKAGDMETMRQVAGGTDAEFELARGLGQVVRAFDGFAVAASNKFGADANTQDMSIDIAGEFESAEEKIDGDSAFLIPKSRTSDESEPHHLKKDGHGWKLDLSFLDKDADARGESEKLPAIAKVWDDAAAQVEAGKFDTFAQAKAAVKRRLRFARLTEPGKRLAMAGDDIASLESALEQYKMDAGEYPQTQDGLLALAQKPAAAINWRGPYLKVSITADPWSHPYVYVSPGLHNSSAYDLHSMGPDGKDGTPDDIDNWSITP